MKYIKPINELFGFGKKKEVKPKKEYRGYALKGYWITDPLGFLADYFGEVKTKYAIRGLSAGPESLGHYYMSDWLKEIESLEKKQGGIEGWQIIAIGAGFNFIERNPKWVEGKDNTYLQGFGSHPDSRRKADGMVEYYSNKFNQIIPMGEKEVKR